MTLYLLLDSQGQPVELYPAGTERDNNNVQPPAGPALLSSLTATPCAQLSVLFLFLLTML